MRAGSAGGRPYTLLVRPLLVTFAGGSAGTWAVDRLDTVAGPALEPVSRVEMVEGEDARIDGSRQWALRGVTSNERYVTRTEHDELVAVQAPLGRGNSTLAALIPITKSDEWWELPQDERRQILEERSHHIAIGLEYLPPVARRLHHGRDLGEAFDFLTWFEFAPEHADAFEELVGRLRGTEEWAYVEREVDIRLSR
jgi:Chlorite dismutase